MNIPSSKITDKAGKENTEAENRKANPVSVKGKTVRLSAKKLKAKKQKIAAKKAFTIKNAKGAVSYKLLSVKGKKFLKKFAVNTKTGKITVKKGLKKGTYKLSILVKAAGDTSFLSAEKVMTVKVVVR